ncbi:App1 family protein [Demequina sp. NBRC 110053]|uniref:App1 family protein n=1 Tax=Demequina sp. NBRC 110053 TaxID=1570342 RepID=UPI000A07B353|nr:phosphatase domain-containing protein [Demequina sp. NBRC 110053]
MSSLRSALGRLNSAAIATAYRAETGLRDWWASRAARSGWKPAVLPYSGYSCGTSARVLGRVVLAPPSFDIDARRGMRGWRHLLTLEHPRADVQIAVGGVTVAVKADDSGIVDARIELERALPGGAASATLKVSGRDAVRAPIHAVSDRPVRGVVCDIDDTAWVTGLAHPFRAAWRTLRGTSGSRRSVPGMADLVAQTLRDEHHPAVVYVSNGPWNFVGTITHFLELQGFPAGALLLTDWGISRTRWFRDGRLHKRSSIARLMEDMPHVTWVLVGDDGEHDPEIYMAAAADHPGRVAAIVLRRAGLSREGEDVGSAHGVPVVRGDDGDALMPLLRAALVRTDRPAGGVS